MVQICEVEWDMVRKARKDEAEELTAAEKKDLGRNVRLEIPVSDLASVKKAADILIGLGNQMRFLADQRGYPTIEKLFEIRSRLNTARGRLGVVNGRSGRKYDKF